MPAPRTTEREEPQRARPRGGARKRPQVLLVLSAAYLLALVGAAIFANHVAPYPMNAQHLREALLPPAWMEGGSPEYVLGTDRLGRDILSELIFGARVSLTVGLGAVLIGLLVGVPLGMIAGYFRGKLDMVISRAIEVQLSVPLILVALLLIAITGAGKNNVILVQGLAGWLIYARLARAQVLSEKERPYVEASVALGARWSRVLVGTLLPNIAAPLIAIATLEVGRNIITETSLSFLGVGVTPPDASWGRMIADGRNVIFVAWWVATWPGVAITATVVAFSIVGDWLRDRLDKRTR